MDQAERSGVGGGVPEASRMPAPIGEEGRLESLDVLRGVAVLGILAMNIWSFSGPFVGYMDPSRWPLPYEGLNRVAYWVTHTLFDLKMMSLFSLLFGAGVVAWGHKARTRGEIGRVRGLWLRRMLWLFLIGMAHAWLLWEGDILVAYALCGAGVAWWVRRWPLWVLWSLAGLLFLIHTGLMLSSALQAWLAFGAHADGPPFGMPKADFERMRDGMREGMKAFMMPTPEMLSEDIASHRGSYADVLGVRAGIVVYLQTFGFAFMLFWRATSMMILGMILMRKGVLTGHRSVRFYGVMAAVCYGIGLPMVVLGILDNEAHGFDVVRTSLVGQPLNVVGSLPVMLGHAALVLMVVKMGVLCAARRALAATGRMALTNYLAQTLICTTLFYGYGLGLYGRFDRTTLLGVVAAIWVVQVGWSVLWLARFRFGPAEWAWRSLTYWKFQPMGRGAGAD